MYTITQFVGKTSDVLKREQFHLLSSAMHVLRQCAEAKIACVLEYVPA